MLKKVIVGAVSGTIGYMAGQKRNDKKNNKEIERLKAYSNKQCALFLLMSQWVKVKQSGKGIADYLEQNNYKKIAIYGMGNVGEILINELYGSGIKIIYGIDRNADNIYAECKVVKPEDKLEQADAVIVTSITYFDEIADDLSMKLNCPILSIEKILCDII